MLTNVPTIKTDAYQKTLDFVIKTGGNQIVLGPAGVGKTEMANQAAELANYRAITIDLSVIEYPDLVGLPSFAEDIASGAKVVQYAAPKFLPLLPKDAGPDHRKIVFIFDEIDKAKEELQNPLLQIFQNRTINGVPLDMQACIATGNLPDEGAFSRAISHALTNRCMVFRLEHDYNTWQEWAVRTGVNGLIVGFLNKNMDRLLQPAVDGDPYAYNRPTPRSWTQAARDLDASQATAVGLTSETLTSFQTMLVSGRVGTPDGLSFRVWLDHYRHIEADLMALVNEGKRPPELQMDRRLIIAISACNELMKMTRLDEKVDDKAKHDAKVMKTVQNVFGWLCTQQADVMVAAAKSTMDIKVIQAHKMTKNADFMKVFTTIKAAYGQLSLL